MKTNLKHLSKNELSLFMERLGQKTYRTNQLTHWIYRKHATSFDDMTDFSKAFREELNEKAFISNSKLVQKLISKDGTEKFLFELEDGESIESVLIPNGRGKGKCTLCISSQVGCAVGCKFCVTGSLGLKRNMKAYEIVDQVMAVQRHAAQSDEDGGREVSNLVLMGMGEPFNNFTEVSIALRKLIELMGISRRKITLSTSGIVPGIQNLAETGPPVNLAISLNATTDKVRSSIMPINRKYPLKELIRACRDFPLSPNRSITFEYVLLGKLNDTKDDAVRLVRLLKGIKSKVNLIPFNPSCETGELRQPSDKRIAEFQDILRKAGMTAMIRKSMGSDISAACGQLKAAFR